VAKAAAFWQVSNYREAYGIFACSGLLFNHESPLRPERFVTRKIISTACSIAKGGKEKLELGNIAIQRDWGWAPEYVEAMWLMMQQKGPEDFVIATGKTHKLEEFLELAFSAVRLDWREYVEFGQHLFRPTDILISRANPARARRVLNWEAAYGLADVVTMMVEAEMGRGDRSGGALSYSRIAVR
jgi:GDPmannose 4,6-dehydratase